jgi:hypothetical protein
MNDDKNCCGDSQNIIDHRRNAKKATKKKGSK